MRIEFDPAKNLRNASERGLGLERAADFDFGTALVWQDTRKANQREVRNYESTRAPD